MPETTVTKTQYDGEDGSTRTQYRTTVPKGIAEAMDLTGSKIEWTIKSGNTIELTKVEE